jgi:hypothetical protein
MSSVSRIKLPPLGRLQMLVIEEIRFKTGDACCSILGQGMTCDAGRSAISDWPPRDAGTQQRTSWGRAGKMVESVLWRWSSCHGGQQDRELTHRRLCPYRQGAQIDLDLLAIEIARLDVEIVFDTCGHARRGSHALSEPHRAVAAEYKHCLSQLWCRHTTHACQYSPRLTFTVFPAWRIHGADTPDWTDRFSVCL